MTIVRICFAAVSYRGKWPTAGTPNVRVPGFLTIGKAPNLSCLSVPNTDGRREVLGVDIGPREAETFLDQVPAQTAPARLERNPTCHLGRGHGW